MISQEQIDFYHENGYLIVPGVLHQEELDEAHAIIDDFVEKSRAVTEQSGHFDLEPDHSPEDPKVRRMSSPSGYHLFFDDLYRRDDRVLDILTPLIGPAIRAQGDKLNMKPAGVGSPVEWHQDFAHYPHSNDDLCAVGIALDDSTEENGCMMVVPGSHRGPVLDHHQDGFFIGAISPERDEIDLVVEVRAAGDARLARGRLAPRAAEGEVGRDLHGPLLLVAHHGQDLLDARNQTTSPDAVVEGLVRFCGIIKNVAVRRRALEADRDQVALHGLLALRVALLDLVDQSRLGALRSLCGCGEGE